MLLTAGILLGRYEVRAQSGAGGMGGVYLSKDTTELTRQVVQSSQPPPSHKEYNVEPT